MIDFLLNEAGSNVVIRDSFVLLDMEFINRKDLDILPKVVDKLVSTEDVDTAVVYGIKDEVVYIVGRGAVNGELRDIINTHFSNLGKVKETNGFTLAMVPLGIAGMLSRENLLRLIDDIMIKVFFPGKGPDSSTAFDRLNEVKQLVTTQV